MQKKLFVVYLLSFVLFFKLLFVEDFLASIAYVADLCVLYNLWHILCVSINLWKIFSLWLL